MEEQVQPQQPQPLQSQQVQTESSVFVHSSSKSKWIVVMLVFIVLVSSGIFGGKYYLDQQKLKAITDFDSCTKAGNPVTASYPGTCRTSDGRSFVQPLSDEEKKKLVPPTENKNLKTYKNSNYQFSFMYQDTRNLKLQENNVSSSGAGLTMLSKVFLFIPNSDQFIQVKLWDNPKKLSAKNWWEINFTKYYKDQVDQIDGKPLRREDFNLETEKIGERDIFYAENEKLQASPYFFSHDIYIVEVLSTLYRKEIDQILSTFKFLD